MKKILLTFSFLFLFAPQIFASHLDGGEITWTCQGNGQFIFKLKIYRDCSGLPLSCLDATSIDVSGLPGLCSIPLSPSCSNSDITPSSCGISCASASNLAKQVWIWTSLPVTLNGVPPATGWTFSWNSCCRNPLQNVGGSGGFSVRSKMFPYQNSNTNPCFDNSPEFLESPKYLLCTGYPQTVNQGATDVENDSLVYSFASPLDQPSSVCPSFAAANIPFNTPYTVNDQFPGNSNVNSITGILSCTNDSIIGNFATCVKVTAYKCGIKVAEVYRDYLSIFINNCLLANPLNANNTAPDIVAPFISGWDTTVCAGDTLRFTLRATDFEGSPPGGTPQQVILEANSLQFGLGYSNPAQGCLTPPCAVLNKTLPSSNPILNSVNFTWATSQNHVKNSTNCLPGYYCFTFGVRDNFCPAPAQENVAVCITVLNCSVNIKNLKAEDFSVFFTDGFINLNLKYPPQQPIEVFITDMLGKTILQKNISSRQNSFKLPDISKGVYLLNLISTEGTRAKKFVVN
jgi:Secretion system C-terminal sorting domain